MYRQRAAPGQDWKKKRCIEVILRRSGERNGNGGNEEGVHSYRCRRNRKNRVTKKEMTEGLGTEVQEEQSSDM